jgi:serine/threonine protein kinase/Tfp pilus assembly protein PilF
MILLEPNGSGGTVTPERWQQVKSVLDGALDQRPAERPVFLDGVCRDDSELRCEVESLLASEAELGDFIEEPLFDLHASGEESSAAGQRIAAYKVIREIGRGGMGSVYLAEKAEGDFEGQFALKVIRRGMDSEEVLGRFRAERRILTQLDHPNIARIFDGGTTEDGRPFFVMERIEGRPIDEFCDAEELSIPERLELFLQVCSAVHFAHQHLVVHRDLKPVNILVTHDRVSKLLDFGIAKILDPERTEPMLTVPDRRPVTPQYASPEQLKGKPTTTASDIYALGVLLYLLLTGRSPYGTPSPEGEELSRAVCEDDPLPPSEAAGLVLAGRGPQGGRRLLRRRLAGDLDNIVLMAMHKDPKERYASVEQLAADLHRHLDGLPVLAQGNTPIYRLRKFVGRHKVGVTMAAAVVLLVLGFSTSVTFLWQKAVQERDRAETVSKFLQDLFTIPDPGESRGKSVTAREVLDRGTEKISEELQDQPELRAQLMDTMGQVYRNLGLFETARKLSEESLAVRRQVLGSDDLQVAESLQNLAILRREMGDDAGAEPLLREALAIQRERGTTDTLEHAKAINDLGALLENKGDYGGAERLYRESLELKRRLLGNEHEDVARSLNNLGHLLHLRGDYPAAEQYYQEALMMRRRLLGQVHPEVATTLNNLASLREDEGDVQGAERLYRDVLEMRRKLYGSRHPRVARSLNNLAFALQAQGKPAAAEPLYQEAVAIADESLGKDHFERAIYLRNLSTALLADGKTTQAEASAREALSVFRKSKPSSWRVADAESVLGSCLARLGQFEQAEPLLLGSYPVLEKDSGDGKKYAKAALNRIIGLYSAWGKPDRVAAYRALLAQ